MKLIDDYNDEELHEYVLYLLKDMSKDDQWHHYEIIRDNLNKNKTTYVDGKKVNVEKIPTIESEYINLRSGVKVKVTRESDDPLNERYEILSDKTKNTIYIDNLEQLLMLQRNVNELVMNRLMKFEPKKIGSRFSEIEIVSERE